MNLISIPTFKDNYIWILKFNNNKCIFIDPGNSFQLFNAIKKNSWQPEAILITHHHYDHVGGVHELCANYPNIKVFGPKEAQNKGVTKVVNDNESIIILGCKFDVIATPGHTLGHISFYSFPYLFCGDTIFSGGCGRIIEGTFTQMYQSFQKINAMPEETLICCAHEYTLENMKFAMSILPNDIAIKSYYKKIKILREKKQKTLPIMLKNERKINLFLRVEDNMLIKEINKKIKLQKPEHIFSWLRKEKDNFC